MELHNVKIAGKPDNISWNIRCSNGLISSISKSGKTISAHSGLVIPSLCHPHIHLDKCFLLSHPKYKDLRVQRGDFAEALEVTNKAKARFEHADLMERGSAMIEESISFGVTHIRAFVEVDNTVGMKCLDAGLAIKEKFRSRCYIQICVFAQDPIFSYHDGGLAMRKLLTEAVQRPGVEAFGSTPYIEDKGDAEKQILNIKFAIETAKQYKLHLDFHIDYNLDQHTASYISRAVDILHASHWPTNESSLEFRTIIFGHCTRLTLFDEREWRELVKKIAGLPAFFVGLPTSDVYMMGKPSSTDGGGTRVRGTLQIPQMITKYGLSAAIGINNVGNAFTPQGSCDPIHLACLCVGIYQSGTIEDTETLLECISTRAKTAIGIGRADIGSELEFGSADIVLLENNPRTEPFRAINTVQDLIYSGGGGVKRTTYFNGEIVTSI